MACLFLALIGCGEKDKAASLTPVSDKWELQIDEFIENQCGGVYDSACDDLFYIAFINDVLDYYNLDSGMSKDCSLYPGTCSDPRETEAYFRSLI